MKSYPLSNTPNRASASIVHSNTDISCLGSLGYPLLFAEWLLGGMEVTLDLLREWHTVQVFLLFPLIGILCVALGMIAASFVTMALGKIGGRFLFRERAEALLVGGVFIVTFYSAYRLIFVELIVGAGSYFLENPKVALDFLYSTLSDGIHLTPVPGYRRTILAFLASRWPALVAAPVFMAWHVGKGRALGTLVTKIEDLMEEEKEEEEDEEEEEEEESKDQQEKSLLDRLIQNILDDDDEDEDLF